MSILGNENEVEITLPDEMDITEALESDLNQVVNLEKNRAWISLKTHLYEKRSHERDKLVRAIFRKNAEPVDQRAIDYARGQIDAIEWMLTLPERMKSRAQ